MTGIRVLLLVCVALVITSPSSAQVVREDGVKSIAGILGGAYPGEVLWTLMSGGEEVIFASLDGEIYKVAAQHEHEGETQPQVMAEEPGGSGGCSGDEGGPVRFCLQVMNSANAVMCQSTRPAPPPGWQRDPRVACVLPKGDPVSTYTIRVSLTGPDGACVMSPVQAPNPHPFLLNVSVRHVAPSGIRVQQAAAQSGNRLP